MLHEVIPILSKREECERMKLARETKRALLLKSVSPLLSYVSVPSSTFPRTIYMLRHGKESFARQEMSLMRAGQIVFSADTATYIDPDTGKTMNVPSHPAVLRELKRCGFETLPNPYTRPMTQEDVDYYNSESYMSHRLGIDVYDKIKTFEDKLGVLKVGDGVCNRTLCISYAINLTNEMQSTSVEPSQTERQIMEFGFNGFNARNECEDGESLQKFVEHALMSQEYLQPRYLRVGLYENELKGENVSSQIENSFDEDTPEE